ncbi:MAG: hypothetical protein HYZ49_08315 [Chloroflexi bacterium]|nr:hypothetical protein [Chloroflexota bacterium]
MITLDFQQVLTAARQLPKRSQLKLASALLKEADAPAPQLEPLRGLNEAELRALAESVLAPRHAKRLKQLLKLNREKQLSRPLKAELDDLLAESDQIALLKAKAYYMLGLHAR